jgi:hypothetical protein
MIVAEPVRRLTELGIDWFRQYLRQVAQGSPAEPPLVLLAHAEASEPMVPELFVETRVFSTRLEAARHLAQVFEGVSGLEEDAGLWSWLSLFYFDQVCPVRDDGTRSPGRDYRHILEPGYRYGHRHLLGGALLVYRIHGDDAVLLLCTKLHQENTFHHELASRQAFVSNRSIIQAVNLLYLDEPTRRPKRGAQDQKRIPGTLTRFVDVVQQLEINYDLYSMSADAIVALLPEEFEGWKPGGVSTS